MSSLSRLKTINERIQNELCMKTIDSLSEQSLLSTYKNTPSVKKKIDTLQSILSSHNIDNNTQQSIIDEYMPHLIPWRDTHLTLRGRPRGRVCSRV